ncbi:MAG: TraR/DksA family transcriptional regulator [Alphaproteobacteria bacterium]|nr:MAG: TraR/DksA family transcriptional regulator [Alphaproteobacteria bacterium]
MSARSIEERKAQLEARLAELEARIDEIEAELDQPASPDLEERATERETDEVLESLENLERAEIEKIRAALQRIEDGEYGYCVRCGEKISEERLDLVPWTPFCAKCAP